MSATALWRGGAAGGGRAPDVTGRTVQVDPIKPKLKPPGTKRLNLKCDALLSTSAFKFNLRRFNPEAWNLYAHAAVVGWCRLTLSNPC